MENDTTILLKKADHHTIMRQEGYYAGYYGRSTAVELVDNIREKLVDQLCKAKGLYVVLYHCDHYTAEQIEHITNEIESLVSDDASTVFYSQIDDGVSTSVLEYEILLSGIETFKAI